MQEFRIISPLRRQLKLTELQAKLLEKQESIENIYLRETKVGSETSLPKSINKLTNILQSINPLYRSRELDNAPTAEMQKSIALIRDSGLFDIEYYSQQKPDSKNSELDPILHYLEEGAWQGLNPHPLFDTAYYLQQKPELFTEGINPLVHYLDKNYSKKFNPHPLFQTAYYLENNPDLIAVDVNPLIHYVQYGVWEERNPHPLFDTRYYLEQNLDIARSHINPLIHYLYHGAWEKRNPHPLFDSQYYLEKNPDVARAKINPLVHYLLFGVSQKRNPHPLFDGQYYLEENPDVAASNVNPLVHYLLFGAWEKRNPHPLFDVAYYLEKNPHLIASGREPLSHYLRQGASDGDMAWSAEKLRFILDERSLKEKYEIEILLTGLASDNFTRSPFPSPRIGVYCSSKGNYFMAEIADLIAAACNRAGAETIRLNEKDFESKDTDYNIVVAPHEFFYLEEGQIWAADNHWLSNTVMINVEQPQTAWFSKSLYFLKRAALVFDINIKTATFLTKIGIPAYFLPLGYLDDYEPFSFRPQRPDLLVLKSIPRRIWEGVDSLDVDWEQRPLDLLFVGHLSDRRKIFFSENAPWLNNHKCFLHIPPLNGPFLQGRGNALTTEAFTGLSQRSKILLNIHQSNLDYFEWHRLVFYGLWQKTLVLTETCHQIPGLIPGEHYLQCELEDMQSKINWLLNTEKGREEAKRIRSAGYEFLKTCLNLEKITGRVLNLIQKNLNRAQA